MQTRRVTLFIGKNDKGVVTGVANAKKLLEDIPKKVRNILGIIIDINLIAENGKECLEIIVEPYPYPVSYKGQYHYRSGSTKQELKGAALDKFLLQKHGKRRGKRRIPHFCFWMKIHLYPSLKLQKRLINQKAL